MRNRGMFLGATLLVGLTALAGCDNTQGTSANLEMTGETTAYTGNDNPQNTGGGSGTMLKPPPMMGSMSGGDTPSQAVVKGTDNATGAFPASLTGPHSGTTLTPSRSTAPASTPNSSPGTAGGMSNGTGTSGAPGGTGTTGNGTVVPGMSTPSGAPGTTGTAAPATTGGGAGSPEAPSIPVTLPGAGTNPTGAPH